MIIRTLTSELSVTEQLTASDLDDIIQSGFKAVVCNRPDEEGEPHLGSQIAAEALQASGIAFHYLPVNGAAITDQDVQNQAQLLSTLPTPALAYCRTGTRCTKLWALDPNNPLTPAQRLQRAENAGINISDLSDRLV